MRKRREPLEKLVPGRIRNRRDALGLQAGEVARRAGISPSYLSAIEGGTRIPSEEIAVRLARALDDHPEIYRAWVHGTRYPDLLEDAERLARVEAYRDDPELSRRLRSGQSVDLPSTDTPPPGSREQAGGMQAASARLRRMAERFEDLLASRPVEDQAGEHGEVPATPQFLSSRASERFDLEAPPPELPLEPPPVVEVPLLADGVDPDRASDVVDVLHVDRRLVPPDAEALFAYRPGPAAVERVQGLIRPGDLVVLAAAPDTVDRGGIYAVRHRGRVVLSRVAVHDNVLLLLPWGDAGEPLSLEVPSERALRERLAGVVVATVRAWPAGRRSTAVRDAIRPEPRGRSVRLEGDFLVRDCEWRDRYGWRPMQRPEDLDWLDAHPGTKVRFRLIRDGRVKYLLEMGPEEWRRALGRYYEGPTWRRNGYIVAITKRKEGEYTEEFQERWAGFVRKVGE